MSWQLADRVVYDGMRVSAPPFRAVVKVRGGDRVAGERALDGMFVGGGRAGDVERDDGGPRFAVPSDDGDLAGVVSEIEAFPELLAGRTDGHGGLGTHAPEGTRGTRGTVCAMQADAGRKYRAYPTEAQAERLTEWGHTCRAIWNVALEQREFLYSQRRVGFNAVDQSFELTALRKELDWVRDLPAQCGQQVLRHLDQAYKNFWNPDHFAAHPTHRKRSARLSITFPGQAVQVRRLNKRWGAVRVPKLGEVRFRWSRDLGGPVRNATVSRDGLGWHIAFGIASRREARTSHDRPGTAVGLDRGVAVAVADSDGGLHHRAFLTAREQAREVALQRRSARQERARKRARAKTSKRARKVYAQLAAIKARTARRRAEFAQQLAHVLADQYETIGIEALQTANMTKSAKGTVEQPGTNVAQKAGLNRAILDKGWFGFEQALRHQARRTGSTVVRAPAAFTSQRCAACGHVAPGNRESQAVFRCVACGHVAHADVNAAINVRDLAVASTAGRAGLGRVSHLATGAASTTGNAA